jgi:hypothetical protein
MAKDDFKDDFGNIKEIQAKLVGTFGKDLQKDDVVYFYCEESPCGFETTTHEDIRGGIPVIRIGRKLYAMSEKRGEDDTYSGGNQT